MDKRGKIERAVTLLMVIALWMPAAICGYIPEKGEAAKEYEGILRFHVIANSDSKEDQELKLGVRDYVLPKIEKELAEEMTGGSGDCEIAEEYAEHNLERIKKWALSYVRDKGFDYEIATKVEVTAIPAKRYDDLYFPAGNYKALTITIGEGKGQNWWCVVFPPLCLIDCQDSAYKEKFGIDAKDKIVLKSKIKQMVESKEKSKQSKKNKTKTPKAAKSK